MDISLRGAFVLDTLASIFVSKKHFLCFDEDILLIRNIDSLYIRYKYIQVSLLEAFIVMCNKYKYSCFFFGIFRIVSSVVIVRCFSRFGALKWSDSVERYFSGMVCPSNAIFILHVYPSM